MNHYFVKSMYEIDSVCSLSNHHILLSTLFELLSSTPPPGPAKHRVLRLLLQERLQAIVYIASFQMGELRIMAAFFVVNLY
jgi:hypothetical protein